MKIRDLLQQSKQSFSFEFFPPKNDSGFEELYKTIGLLKQLHPTFVSVTYGAGGSTRRKTIELVARIKHEIQIESMAHLTCVGSTREEIDAILTEIQKRGIENVLALRGDPPRGAQSFVPTPGGFRYANELVAFIRQKYDFCIGVAGYPEGHQESPSLQQDLENLKRKVDAGGDFIITQLFFDNRFYFDFVERARRIGITIPIIPGIMPIINFGQIKRFTEMCGASIPSPLLHRLEAIQEDREAVEAYGIEYATLQCQELLANGAPGIHFYTLNRSKATWQIFQNLQRG
ncbi:MAG: methylenetetrahydrofolate reductase [NAD(P)H] [Nitrospinota bacterium]|nr:MAG: methylenetetrahydrofolate reductase [NAD(P)H] [Nitrospinota bacterium]